MGDSWCRLRGGIMGLKFMPMKCCYKPCVFPFTFCYETEPDDYWDLTGEITYHTSKPSYIPAASIPPIYGPFNTFPIMPYSLYYQQQFNSGWWGLANSSGWYSCLKEQMKCSYDAVVRWTTGFGEVNTYRWIATDKWYYYFYMPDGYAAVPSNPDLIMLPYQAITMHQMVKRTYTLIVNAANIFVPGATYTGEIWIHGGHLYWALPPYTYEFGSVNFPNCGWTDCSVDPEPLIRAHSMSYAGNYPAVQICPTINTSQIYTQGILPYDFSNSPNRYNRGTNSDATCADHYVIDLYDCDGTADGLIIPSVGCGGAVAGGTANEWISTLVVGKPQTPIAGTGGMQTRGEAVVDAIGTGSTNIVATGGLMWLPNPISVEVFDYKINNPVVSSAGIGSAGIAPVGRILTADISTGGTGGMGSAGSAIIVVEIGEEA